MQSNATTVDEYLSALPADRREAIEAVRHVILQNLPEGYEEVMNWGMITYQVPLQRYPKTYNGKPLMYAALASQKQHMPIYLTGIYIRDETRQEFEEKYRATGKRFDVGKSCVRFKKLADLPLPPHWSGRGILKYEGVHRAGGECTHGTQERRIGRSGYTQNVGRFLSTGGSNPPATNYAPCRGLGVACRTRCQPD